MINKNLVYDNDYSRLGRKINTEESYKKGNLVKKIDKKAIHVNVLEKRERNTQTKGRIEVGLRVWSKKGRKKNPADKGVTLNIVNRGKVQLDRKVTMESLNIHQFKENKKKITGVYTRIGVRSENPSQFSNDIKNVYQRIQKNKESASGQNRKRIGIGRKDKDTGKRIWFNTIRTDETQRRSRMDMASELTRVTDKKRDGSEGLSEGLHNRSDNLKTVYASTILKGLMKHVRSRVRMTASINQNRMEGKVITVE